MQEIFNRLSVGYATRLVDMNDDGKLDIVVVDTERVIWLENPDWKLHTLVEHATKKDNVSIAESESTATASWISHWRPMAPVRYPHQRHAAMARAASRLTTRGPCIRSASSLRCIGSALSISTPTAATNWWSCRYSAAEQARPISPRRR